MIEGPFAMKHHLGLVRILPPISWRQPIFPRTHETVSLSYPNPPAQTQLKTKSELLNEHFPKDLGKQSGLFLCFVCKKCNY